MGVEVIYFGFEHLKHAPTRIETGTPHEQFEHITTQKTLEFNQESISREPAIYLFLEKEKRKLSPENKNKKLLG